jgi:Predicted NADH:ubiquinone oxidoreductase, subunit RnfG
MRARLTALGIFLLLSSGAPAAFAQTSVFLKPADALKLIFKDSKEVYKEDKALGESEKAEFKRRLGYQPPRDSYSFYLGKSGDHVDGYAIIDEEVGKVLPITFITRISPQGKVDAVEVMVYRESHGGEVSSRRFLNQFKQKGLNDEIRLHGSIVNITGATLSSRALVLGVNRALVLWRIFYDKSPAQPTS